METSGPALPNRDYGPLYLERAGPAPLRALGINNRVAGQVILSYQLYVVSDVSGQTQALLDAFWFTYPAMLPEYPQQAHVVALEPQTTLPWGHVLGVQFTYPAAWQASVAMDWL